MDNFHAKNKQELTAMTQIMCQGVFVLMLLSMVTWPQVTSDTCIFHTSHYRKAPNTTVLASFNVTNYKRDCEFLCYTHPDQCVAANVIVQVGDTYLCQFVSVAVQKEFAFLLESNPEGKYISRYSAVPDRVNVASLEAGANCTVSTYFSDEYICTNVLDGQKTVMNRTEWASNGETIGAWIQIHFPIAHLITEIILYARCSSAKDVISDVNLHYSDGTSEQITGLPCPPLPKNCTDVPGENRTIGPIVTDFVRIEVIGVCDGGLNNGFREVEIISLKP